MYRVPQPLLRPGMRVGKDLRSADGRLLLAAGTELRASYIEHLGRIGVPSVYIRNELAPDVTPPSSISDETQAALTSEVRQLMNELRGGAHDTDKSRLRRWLTRDTSRLQSAVSQVVDELAVAPESLVQLQDIRVADEYTFGHSVSVCVLATATGLSLGLTNAQSRDLAMGALLHDLGKVTIDPAILNKPGRLTTEEMQEVQQHTVRGFDLLREQHHLSTFSALMALQHHEQYLGGGYPSGSRSLEIHQFGRICAVPDVFDALTSDRPYRVGLPPLQAINLMRTEMPGHFDPEIFRVFMQSVAPYPVGSMVELDTGEVAVVVQVIKGQALTPRVRVVKAPDGSPLSAPWDLQVEPARGPAIRRGVQDVPDPTNPPPEEIA